MDGRNKCAICGKEAEFDQAWVLTRPGDLLSVCRHGHFSGEHIDDMTSMVWNMTGPIPLDSLIWAPELFVPKLKPRWWNAKEATDSLCV